MNLNGNVEMKGKLSIIVTGQDGSIKQEMVVPNLVVTAGKGYIASRMVGTASTVMSHMAIGAGTTAPVVGNTTMESSLYRAALTSFTASTNVVTAVATFAGGLGTGAITEAGIFNDATTGTMLCRTTFPVVNKGAGDSIAITWSITVS
jgi:hypothetical protein